MTTFAKRRENSAFDFSAPSAKGVAITKMQNMLQRRLMQYLLQSTGFFLYKSTGNGFVSRDDIIGGYSYWQGQICRVEVDGATEQVACVSSADK